MSLRMEKVNRELRKQIMGVIQKEVDDPIMDFLSITRVITTKDLQESKVYFSLLNDANYDKAQDILDKMGSFIRTNLARKVRLKVLPQLKFFPDESIRYSIDVHQKMEEIKGLNIDNETENIKENSREDKQ